MLCAFGDLRLLVAIAHACAAVCVSLVYLFFSYSFVTCVV